MECKQLYFNYIFKLIQKVVSFFFTGGSNFLGNINFDIGVVLKGPCGPTFWRGFGTPAAFPYINMGTKIRHIEIRGYTRVDCWVLI